MSIFLKVIKTVFGSKSDKDLKALEPYVEEYISLYGAQAQDLRCETRAAIGSNIKEVICIINNFISFFS